MGLIIVAMYSAMTIGLSVYIAHENNLRGQEYAAQQQSQQTKQMQDSIAAWGKHGPEEQAQKEKDELAGKLPSLFADPEGYETEDNWLASGISREIAAMAFFAAKPDAPLPKLKVMAKVDPAQGHVHVEIEGWAPETTTSDLTPLFAWDPNGYAPLARQLITTPGVASDPELANNDVLSTLLELTGPKLADEDVKLSANLKAHPASWPDHEAAALLLATMALRDEGGTYADIRPLLNKATAHLALAQAWRGDAHPTWAGLVADATIRTLAGREVDALAQLEKLSATSDLPEAAKPWLAALRVRTTQDWRKAEVTEKSPLLLKIVWIRIVGIDLDSDGARPRLLSVVPQPDFDPNLASDQQKTNPDTLIPDWGRITGASPFYDEGDDSVKNAQYKLDLEFHELDEILKVEKAAPFDLDHLATVFGEAATDTVTTDADGTTVLRVIGPGNFKTIALGHIFDGMISKDLGRRTDQDTAQAQVFFTKMDGLFHDVPNYDFVRQHLGFIENDETQKQYAAWEAAKKTWPVWEVPHSLAQTMPGGALVASFYRNAVPFGTVFEADYNQRYGYIRNKDPYPIVPFDTPELEALKKLPPQQAINAMNEYAQKIGERQAAIAPTGPQPFELELLKLDPDQYLLATDYVPNDKLLPAAARFLDYVISPLERIETVDAVHLSDADRAAVVRKHVALEPGDGFRAAVILRGQGLPDEAAEMDRKAFAANENSIGTSNQVLPLVDYDLSHGRNDEALKVATFAGQVNSEMGLYAYTFALEKLGRLDEAEAAAKQDAEEYGDNSWVLNFQLRHPSRYPQVYADELKRAFPDGLVHTKLADFAGAPATGDQVTSDSNILRAVGLQPGDVIVGLDGFKVGSDAQYVFVRALSSDSKMDFIYWRGGKYAELKANVPGRRMMVDLQDYRAK